MKTVTTSTKVVHGINYYTTNTTVVKKSGKVIVEERVYTVVDGVENTVSYDVYVA
jgi:hypothetical protein